MQRWVAHHKYKELEMIGGIKIVYLFVDSPELLPQIESALIFYFDPPLNVLGKPTPISPDTKKMVSCVTELRKRLNLTQKQLAKLVGVTETTIRNWENDRSAIEWFERIACIM